MADGCTCPLDIRVPWPQSKVNPGGGALSLRRTSLRFHRRDPAFSFAWSELSELFPAKDSPSFNHG